MTFKEFKNNWENIVLPSKRDHIRKGQSLMIYLSEVWHEEYLRLSSVHFYEENYINCFYNDSLIPNTLKHLEKVWKNKN